MSRIRNGMAATVAAIGLAQVGAADPPGYEIVDLGVLGDGTNPNVAANATGLNELGHVAGAAEDDSLDLHAVLWRDGEIIDLGTLMDGGIGYAKGVNELDVVVGWATAPAPGSGNVTARPFVWIEGEGMSDPALPFGYNGECWGINDNGQLAITLGRAHYWDPVKGLVEIKYDDAPASHGSKAWEINNNGIVCGEAPRADSNRHAFRYDIATDTIEELEYDPAVDGITIAYGINDRNDVAGWSGRLDNVSQAMVWTADGPTIRFPYQVFGSAYLSDSAGHINNYGDVVGRVTPSGLGTAIGWIAYDVLASGGAPVKLDLRTLLGPADQIAWTYLHPFEINDRGQICGIGIVDGATRAFLMTPCVVAGDVNFDGNVDTVDLLALLAGWGGSGRREDCDHNGIVDVDDLLCLLANWGAPPPC